MPFYPTIIPCEPKFELLGRGNCIFSSLLIRLQFMPLSVNAVS